MKKLFALLLLMPLLFVACDDDDKKEEKPYFNPVEGSWVYSLPEYNYTETRVFTKQFEASSISNNNGTKKTTNYGEYTVNKTSIVHKDLIGSVGAKLSYTITKDTLELKNPESDWMRKYTRIK